MPDPAPGPPDFGAAFTALLRAADLTPDRVRAALRGSRSLVSRTTLYDWMKGEHLPEDDGALLEIAELCLDAARRRGVPVSPAPADRDGWRRLLADAKQARDTRAAAVAAGDGAGPERARPVRSGLTIGRWNPVALGVHRAIGGGPLPGYVRRPHDELLRKLLDPAVFQSRVVLLRGSSSTGKTRAAYEGVAACLADWPVTYPRTAAILARRIQEGIAPRTVMWLDDLWQFTGPDGDVLAELGDALARSGRVVVIATMWPSHWAAYLRDSGGRRTEAHEDERPVRERADSLFGLKPLLQGLPELPDADAEFDPAFGGIIDVPDLFTAAELTRASSEGDRAVISAIAAARTSGSAGMVAQYLAGVPDLAAHYAGPGADPYGTAIITAAIDLARLGHAGPYPEPLLHDAVLGYLDSSRRTVPQRQWWPAAVGYATRELNGAIAALMPVPPLAGTGVEGYRLADYLEQRGQRDRRESRGPASLWAALVAHPSQSADLTRLGQSAVDRGLYRHAAFLWKKAILAGGISAIEDLLDLLRHVDPRSVRRAALWVAGHAPAGDPGAVARMIRVLRGSRRHDHDDTVLTYFRGGDRKHLGMPARRAASALAARAAELVALSDPDSLAAFVSVLGEIRAGDVLRTLVARLASAPAGSIGVSPVLLRELAAAGEQDAAVALALRLVSSGDLSAPHAVALALDTASECGDQQARVRQVLLRRRPVARVAVSDTSAVARLLRALRQADAAQASALAERAADQVPLTDPADVVALLEALRDIGADAAIGKLLTRNPVDQVTLRDAGSVKNLFELLRETGRPDLATALGRRFATQAPLDAAWRLHRLFHELVRAGEHESASLLARRAVARRALRPLAWNVVYTWEGVFLIGELYQAGERDAAMALAAQVLEEEGPAQPWRHSGTDDLLAIARRMRYEYPAATEAINALLTGDDCVRGPLENPVRVAISLKWLDRAGAAESIDALLSRHPERHVSLRDPASVARLLGTLRRLNAADAVAGLLARRPADLIEITDASGAAALMAELHAAHAADQVAALAGRVSSQPVTDAGGAADLLRTLSLAQDPDAIATLARQAAQQTSLTDANGTARLLQVLTELSLPELAAIVAGRAAGQTVLDDANDVADLLDALVAAGANHALAALTGRAADAGHFQRLVLRDLVTAFPFGREPDGSASPPWSWQDVAEPDRLAPAGAGDTGP